MKKLKEYLVLVKKLLVLVRPLRGVMVLAIIFGALGNILATGLPTLGAMALTGYGAYGIKIKKLAILLGGMALARALLRYLEQLCNHFVAFRVLEIIRDKVFKALRRLGPAKMEGADTGDLVSLITADIELLEVFYAHTISPVLIATIHSLFFFVLMVKIHPAYGIVILASHLVMALVVPIMTSNRARNTGDEQRQDVSRLNSSIMDTFYGIEESTQFFHGPERRKEMQAHMDKLNRSSTKLSKVTGENQSISNTIILISYMAILVVGAYLFRQGSLGPGGLVVGLILFMSSFGPVLALSDLANNLLLTFACGQRLVRILEEEPQVEDVLEGENIESLKDLRVTEAGFSYGGEEVLRDFNLEAERGEILGIQGKSGSGKSTLLKLIMRFYDLDKGKIEKNKTDIREINTKNLRRTSTYITQSTHLFNETILENLRIARADATEEEVMAACKKASIHEFIQELPQGYHTKVGRVINSLSTGEKQRIAIARGFLQDADLLLLDEPTSNIDSLNEGIILKSIWEEHRDKLVILVSHKKSTLRIADRIQEVKKIEK